MYCISLLSDRLLINTYWGVSIRFEYILEDEWSQWRRFLSFRRQEIMYWISSIYVFRYIDWFYTLGKIHSEYVTDNESDYIFRGIHAYCDTSGSRSTFSLSNLINILAVHSANSFFPLCISAVLGSEYCSGYMDALGKWNTGFYCPNSDESNDVFCCGTEIHKYCCTKKDKVIQSEVQE